MYADIAKSLLAHGADPSKKDAQGVAPLDTTTEAMKALLIKPQ